MTFQLLKEQNKYDQVLSGLFDRMQRILPLTNKVADDIVCEETGILETTIPRMFEVMQTVANFACGYVKRGRFGIESLSDLMNADDRSEDERWAPSFEGQGNDRENGERVDQGHRRFRSCSEYRGSSFSQGDW